jgi:hypothetical protein
MDRSHMRRRTPRWSTGLLASAVLAWGAGAVRAQAPLQPEQTAEPQQATATASRTVLPPATATLVVSPPATPAGTLPATAGTPPVGATAKPSEAPETLPNEERPIIILDRYDVEPGAPLAGQTFRLKLELRNKGEHLAENIRVSLSSSSFLPVREGSLVYSNAIDEGDGDSIETELRVAADAKAGSHPITVGLRWDDSWGGTYSDEVTIGVEVGGSGAARPILAVTGTRLPARVVPGIPFTLQLDLLNTGGKEARAVNVAPTQGALALVGGAGTLVNIAPGASATVTVRLVAAQVQVPGASSQTVELRYDSPEGEHFADPHPLGLSITGDAATGPLPLIAAYRLNGEENAEIHPGETFSLELDLVNAGAGAAQQTRMILGSGGAGSGAGSGSAAAAGAASLGVFAPVGTSNVRFLDLMPAGQSRTESLRLVVDGAAKPGVYTLEVGFQFVDADGEAQSASSVVSILVSRKLNLVINPVQVVTSTLTGQPMTFVVDIVNQGSSTVNLGNAELLTDGHFALGATVPQYIGQLDAAGFYTLQGDLVPTRAGKAEVTVRVHYQDDFNREQILERVFPVLVEALEEPPVDPETLKPRLEEGPLALRILKGLLGLGASPKLVIPEAEGPPAGDGALPLEPPGGAVKIEPQG